MKMELHFITLVIPAGNFFTVLTRMRLKNIWRTGVQKDLPLSRLLPSQSLTDLNTPNAEGNKPLIDNDPLKPNEAYFAHVDWVIKKAPEKGIFIGLLPTWGDKVDPKWGKGPKIFTNDNALKYGQWIGKRYKDFQNIIWINGGDRDGGGDNTVIWNAIGEGIKSVDKNHLMTFHPWGEHSSSEWFQNSCWLDFNMCQTGHGQRSYAIYKRIIVRDYNLTPCKALFRRRAPL